MRHDLSQIPDPETRNAFQIFYAQRIVLRDFFAQLSEDQFDYRMVDRPGRRSDTPRESLVHLITVQRWYIQGLTSGELSFAPIDDSAYRDLPGAGLLAELDRLDDTVFNIISQPDYSPQAPVACPWGTVPRTVMIHIMRDHDILHIGWNLALMDHLDIPRYESLRRLWG
jgi:uncharacterized damage-inducible protein DinB